MPAISVLLPVYNGADTLAAALASLAGQTWRDYELIAVDDGSTDGSLAVLQHAAARDARMRVLALPRSGLVGALNAGLAACTAPLVARMDADDIAHAERLAEQAVLLEREPAVGVASCLVEFGGDRVANEGYALHVDWLNALTTPEAIALNRFVEAPVAHPSVMFRRSCVDAFGGYRSGDFPEDYELWLRWIDSGVRIQKVPKYLLRWNDPPARLSRTDARYAPDRFYAAKAPWIARELARTAPQRAVWVWGAGRPTRKRAALLCRHGIRISGYIDIDPKKSGRELAGVPVISPASLPPPADAFVLGYVASRGARELIRGHLQRSGYSEGRDFLMCA